MTVLRIVANLHTDDFSRARGFYQDILGLELMMDHGWIQTFGSSAQMPVQISLAAGAVPARRYPISLSRWTTWTRYCSG